MVIADLLRRGKRVLLPLVSVARYDLVVEEEDGRFVRVQAKTAARKHGGAAIVFPCASTHWQQGAGRTRHRSYHGDVDVIAVADQESGTVYYVPVELTGRRDKTLRLRPSTARNASSQSYAHDFLEWPFCRPLPQGDPGDPERVDAAGDLPSSGAGGT